MHRIVNPSLYILGILLLLEVSLRVVFPLPEFSNLDRSLFVTPAEKGIRSYYRHRPFYWESILDTSNHFVLKYNGYGFRDDEWEAEKQDGVGRILITGDSFVEGVMVEQGESIPAIVEHSSVADIEVMNAGMLGTDVSHYLQLIADMVPVYQPDHVIMVIYENDFLKENIRIPNNTLSPIPYSPLKPRLIELLTEWNRGYPVPAKWLAQPIQILPKHGEKKFVWKAGNELDKLAPKLSFAMKNGQFNHHRLNQIKRHQEQTNEDFDFGEAVEFLRFYASKFEFEPMVVFIPSRNAVSDHYLKYDLELCPDCGMDFKYSFPNKPLENLRKSCYQAKVPFIDMTQRLIDSEASGHRNYWNYDEHFNATGNALVAQTISDHMSIVSGQP